jgi:hypothetical protein
VYGIIILATCIWIAVLYRNYIKKIEEEETQENE